MWKYKVEQKYKIEALAKSDIEYVIEKYTDKAVMDKERIFFIPAQAKTLKTPTTKLYPSYDGPAGFMAFSVSEIKNKKTYAARLDIFKKVKYVHVVKARLSLTAVDMSKKDRYIPSKFGILQNVDKDHPDMSVFTSYKGFQIVETVEHTAPVEQLTQEEKDVLGAYAPDFGHPTQYMKQMSLREAKQLLPHMSADDVAWHMMHNKYAVDLHDDVRLADKHIGRREASFLLVMNKAISQSHRNSIADWLIDKAGVSFVAGPNMHTFLAAMAKQGLISKRFLSELSEDSTEDDIYYNKITDPDELRKFSIAKYYHQLANNVHTPPDVLKKIHDRDVKQSKKGGAWIPPSKDPEVNWTGTNPSMGGKPGRDYWFRYTDVMSNPNYPIADLVELYKRYRKKYKSYKAVQSMASTLWGREDLPQDVMKDLMKDVGHYLLPPPAALKEEDFTAYWKLAKPQMSKQDSWHKFENTAEHPNVTAAVLKDLMKIDLGDEKEATIKIAVKKLQEMGKLDKETVVNKVKKSLKFDGPADLLHHFGAKAWNAKGIETLKFIEAPPAQTAQIKKEMVDASAHDNFTFEVMGVYNLSRSIHKDFDATAKKLGNIKEGVYHGTSMDNAAGILLSGINTSADSRTGQMFGAGFYLASSSSKAAQYASDNFSHSGMGIVFKMDAALGNNAEWKYGRPMGDDSWGSGNRDPALEKKKKAYAKKNKIKDHEVATWHITNDSVHAKKGMALQHDEYVVKQGNQIKINQVILIHKTPVEGN